MTNFTPEDLLEFYYNEMPANSRSQMSEELTSNWALRQKMVVIEEAARRLDKSLVSPDDRVIQRIMGYAETTRPVVQVGEA